MSFDPLYEPAKRVIIRSRLVATMHKLARLFGIKIADVHEIARRELADDEIERPSSESAP